MDQTWLWPPEGNRHLQGLKGQVLLHAVTYMPAHNPPTVGIHHDSQINPAPDGGDVG